MKNVETLSFLKMSPGMCRQSDVIRTFDWAKLKEKLEVFQFTSRGSALLQHG